MIMHVVSSCTSSVDTVTTLYLIKHDVIYYYIYHLIMIIFLKAKLNEIFPISGYEVCASQQSDGFSHVNKRERVTSY